MRKSGLRRREGSRGGPASHKAAEARLECTSRAYGLECPSALGQAQRSELLRAAVASAAAHPSATLAMCAAGPVCGKDGQRARRRAPCARSVRRPPETSLHSPWHAPVHVGLMLHTRRMGAMRCALMGGARAKDLVNRAWFGFYMRWAVGEGPGACCCATVCCVSACLSIAIDREFDLFQRTYRVR